MSAAPLVGPTQQTQASDHTTTAKIQEAETSTGGQDEDGEKAIEKKEKAGSLTQRAGEREREGGRDLDNSFLR
eukprot:COSAG05_NODE_379_length_10567_cov_18.553687_9_plen_73_part_00